MPTDLLPKPDEQAMNVKLEELDKQIGKLIEPNRADQKKLKKLLN